MSKLSSLEARKRRHRRVRGKVTGTAERPRLVVSSSEVRVRVYVDADDPCATSSGVSRPRRIAVLVTGPSTDLGELDRPMIEDNQIHLGRIAIGLELQDAMYCAVPD